MIGRTFLSLLLLFSLAFSVKAQIILDKEDVFKIGNQVTIFEDKQANLSIDSVTKRDYFTAVSQAVPNLGVSNSSFWVRIIVSNHTNVSHYLLELAQPTINEVAFYSKNKTGNFHVIHTGESYPFKHRLYNYQNFIFDLTIAKNQTDTFYLNVRSGDQIQLPLTIQTPQQLFETNLKRDLIFGIYAGIILVMFLYNLFIYLSIKDKAYLYYVVYILITGLTQANFQGYAFKYLWSNNIWISINSVYVLSALVGMAAVEFMKAFLQTKQFFPKLNQRFMVCHFIYCICIALALFKQYNLSYNLVEVNAMLTAGYMMYVANKIRKKGHRPAMFFLIAWSIFLLGVFVFVFKDFGILPYNNFTYYMMPFGSALEIILLSFGLADSINILKKEKEASQLQALTASKENERIIREQNVMLESKVKERTEELQIANTEINITLDNLKQTQAQLVDAEKMASLGQLTAGIAHEINNPINFVLANVKPLRRDINDILSLVDKYNEITPETNINVKLEEINRLKTQLDMDYLVTEINALLGGIDEGAARTSEIVRGLKNFSRLDESDLKKTNINEGLESTLTLLNTYTKGKIKVTKEVSEIPEIECYPGKLNQVFMNIMNNAIQAINASGKSDGELKIATDIEDGNIKISIKDNGVGMSEEVKARIFEPFYTTKNVGEGSGLGLSIVYGIIEKHKGRISVESTFGIGTEFTILLPIQ